MTAETDIAAIGTGQLNTALEVRTALTSVLARADGVWTTYAPVWTTSGTPPAIGNGTLTGRFVAYGDTIIGSLSLTAGSTTTFGTGTWTFTLPVTPALPNSGVGIAYSENAGVQGYLGVAGINATGLIYAVNPLSTVFTGTSPFTWGVGDFMNWSFSYEGA